MKLSPQLLFVPGASAGAASENYWPDLWCRLLLWYGLRRAWRVCNTDLPELTGVS